VQGWVRFSYRHKKTRGKNTLVLTAGLFHYSFAQTGGNCTYWFTPTAIRHDGIDSTAASRSGAERLAMPRCQACELNRFVNVCPQLFSATWRFDWRGHRVPNGQASISTPYSDSSSVWHSMERFDVSQRLSLERSAFVLPHGRRMVNVDRFWYNAAAETRALEAGCPSRASMLCAAPASGASARAGCDPHRRQNSADGRRCLGRSCGVPGQ